MYIDTDTGIVEPHIPKIPEVYGSFFSTKTTVLIEVIAITLALWAGLMAWSAARGFTTSWQCLNGVSVSTNQWGYPHSWMVYKGHSH